MYSYVHTLYIYVHICDIYTYIYMYAYAYVYTYIHMLWYTCTRPRIYIYMQKVEGASVQRTGTLEPRIWHSPAVWGAEFRLLACTPPRYIPMDICTNMYIYVDLSIYGYVDV